MQREDFSEYCEARTASKRVWVAQCLTLPALLASGTCMRWRPKKPFAATTVTCPRPRLCVGPSPTHCELCRAPQC